MRTLLAVIAACHLAQADVIRGKLLDSQTGFPVSSAAVRVLGLPATVPGSSTESDETGLFTTLDLRPGDYRIEITKTGYLSTILRVRVPASSALTARLAPLAVISGTALNAQGQALRGSRVRAVRKQRSAVEQTMADVIVDDRGRYRLHGLPPGEYAVVLSYSSAAGTGLALYPSGGNESGRFTTLGPGERREGVDFIVGTDTRSNISGTLKLPQGRERGRFRVSLTADSFVVASQEIEADAEFRFDGVAPGPYQVAVAGPAIGFTEAGAVVGERPLFGRVRLDVVGSDVKGLVVSLDEGRTAVLSSRAVADDAGGCPKTAWATLRAVTPTAAFLPQSAVRLEMQKEQAVGGMPPGAYSVAITGLGDACYVRGFELDGAAVSEPVFDASESEHRFTIVLSSEMGGIAGSVSALPEELSGIAVALAALDDAADGKERPDELAYPDAQGRFTFDKLRPGRYRVTAMRVIQHSAGSSAIEVKVDPGKKSAIHLELPPAPQKE